jgi:hypothetical protein
VLRWPALLAIAPHLIGFGQAKMGNRFDLREWPALEALTGAGRNVYEIRCQLSLYSITDMQEFLRNTENLD